MSVFDVKDDWVEYALSMADDAERGGRDLSLVSARLEALTLEASMDERLRSIIRRQQTSSEEGLPGMARSLFGEFAHWILEFMVAASYMRQERSLSEEELSVAVARWFSRYGMELSEAERTSLTNSFLVKSLLNDAKPFMVMRTAGAQVSLVEAPLLVCVEHGRYRVTDETENYLYHLDSTIDSFASGYSLMAARMGRELDSRSYGKSSHTVMEMIAAVGHIRRLMATLVDETGRIGPDEQSERFEAIKRNIDAIRASDTVEHRYREEVARIWESWSAEEAMDRIREMRGDRLSHLRSLHEGLRILDAAKTWMYDEYATLSERCEEVTRHYLRSSIVTTLFSLDDLMDKVAHTDLSDVGWLDTLLLPATCIQAGVAYEMPPMVTLDTMFKQIAEEEERVSPDLNALLEADEQEDVEDEIKADELAKAFGAWLSRGGGSVEEWIASRSPEELYSDMQSFDLARLLSSLLMLEVEDVHGATSLSHDGAFEHDSKPGRGRIASFADATWLHETLSPALASLRVCATKTGEVVEYLGSSESADVVGTLEDIRFEVTVNE